MAPADNPDDFSGNVQKAINIVAFFKKKKIGTTPSSHSHLVVSFEFVTGQVSVSIYYTEELLNSLRGEHFVIFVMFWYCHGRVDPDADTVETKRSSKK